MISQLQPITSEQRVVRVFVSSTFRDMQEERDHLVKFVFPQLRKMCEERGVTWGEVDLRWGITQEQAERGEVLPICLEEISRCRPYFIGLLGERYGWVPDEIPEELIEREAWLAEHLDHSVTELEILHGVLNNPAMADHALFYFRDRAYAESQPEDKQPDFLELPTDEDISKYGQQQAARRSEERSRKLASLKDRIRASGLWVRENYPTPQVVGEMVLDDMRAIIERLYPIGEKPSQLDRDAADHEAFAQSRARVYIGRQEYFDRLDEHARGEGPPLAVLGESGSGKSALLANWALRYRSAHSEELLLMHFIGATPYSTDWAAMLRRIMGEFARRLGIEQEIPDKPDALRSAFANWLHMAAARGKVVLIVDALNQLEDRDSAPDLVWLPPVIPSNIRLIVSALPGRALDDLKKRGWPEMEVNLLECEERKQLIPIYLAQYSKALSPERIDRIAAADQTANPLYLRALLDELRVFGVHEKLDERIEHYLAANDPKELYERILVRWEQDYEQDLVRKSMSLIWAARRGLSEAELLDLLGNDSQPLPRAKWTPLYIAAESSLAQRSGLLGFFHNYVRKAVHDRYLPSPDNEKAAHRRLAEYFDNQEELSHRKLSETAWQYSQAGEWLRLYQILQDLEFFEAAWDSESFEIKVFWTQVESQSALTVSDAYRSVIQMPSRFARLALIVAELLAERGKPDIAFQMRSSLVTHFRDTKDDTKLLIALIHLVESCLDRADYPHAAVLLDEAHRLGMQLTNLGAVSRCLNQKGRLLRSQGDLRGALAAHEEDEQLSHALGDRSGVMRAVASQVTVLMGNEGEILRPKALRRAIRLLKRQEEMCRELGDREALAACLGNQAKLLIDGLDIMAALSLHAKVEAIYREVGNLKNLAISLTNQADLLVYLGRRTEALLKAREAWNLASVQRSDSLERMLKPRIEWLEQNIGDKEMKIL